MMAPLLAVVLAVAPAPEAPKSFLDEPTIATPDKPRSMAQAVGMTAVVLAMGVGVCVAYARTKQNAGGQAAMGGQINLLAYKPIGHKQRLALVEVCGERLLLAANEREVTLLSHLPGAAVQEPEMAAADSYVEANAPSAAVSGRTVRAMEEALEQKAPAPAATQPAAPSFSSDLAGLQQWQQRAQSERRA